VSEVVLCLEQKFDLFSFFRTKVHRTKILFSLVYCNVSAMNLQCISIDLLLIRAIM